jgi:hypothetical protein
MAAPPPPPPPQASPPTPPRVARVLPAHAPRPERRQPAAAAQPRAPRPPLPPAIPERLAAVMQDLWAGDKPTTVGKRFAEVFARLPESVYGRLLAALGWRPTLDSGSTKAGALLNSATQRVYSPGPPLIFGHCGGEPYVWSRRARPRCCHTRTCTVGTVAPLTMSCTPAHSTPPMQVPQAPRLCALQC